MSVDTVALEEMWNGRVMFRIYEVDDNGQKIKSFDRKTGEALEPRPIFNMGAKKAGIILGHVKDLEHFINRNK